VSSSPIDPQNGAAAAAAPSAAARPQGTVDVTMPQMGVSMAEGTLIAWHKRVGDRVNADETICEISTDKIDSEVPAPAAGRVLEILVAIEQTVPVGAVLARITTDALAGDRSKIGQDPDEHVGEPDAGVRPAQPRADRDAAESAAETERASAAVTPPQGARRVYSPVVQRIAASEGVDLERVPGTGRGGRVSKQDVLAFIAGPRDGEHPRDSAAQVPNRPPPPAAESVPGPAEFGPPPAQPPPPAAESVPGPAESGPPPAEPPLHTESPYREPAADASARPERDAPERLSRMRRSIAEHMLRSLQTAATCTSVIEADFSGVEATRAALGLSQLPFVARSVIDALSVHCDLNATLEGESLTRHSAVNLGVAISLGRDGLIVPVIRDAHELAPEGLARRISDLATRARAGELSPDEVSGGTFTITNPGGYGTLVSTPIINQPQVAILDLEAVVKRPVVVRGEDGGEEIAIRPMAYLCLSWDHRALDGALAAQFLSTVRARIESWGVR
jgi:pyruvate/2-oxoglutarate dehydrogenase complex dihydrolipoamide acyltransferase (E2) component